LKVPYVGYEDGGRDENGGVKAAHKKQLFVNKDVGGVRRVKTSGVQIASDNATVRKVSGE
jgi:hypothetical protein